jgi:carbonic anhydrase/acetyltransferase-like protein (isoleucine patch superfamily)
MLYRLDSQSPQLLGDNFVADSAELIGQVVLERGASVWFGCVLRADNDEIRVGENSNVQDQSMLHTDPGLPLRVGRGCTIGHQVMLHGCQVGDNTLIGMKSVILNRAVIGANSIVGANSLVTEGKKFPDGVMILGAPAKVVRELSPEEIQGLQAPARGYAANAQRFIKGLQRL